MEASTVAASAGETKLQSKPCLVGIGGATAAGKTSLARALAETFRGLGSCLLDMDSYYLDQSYLEAKQREALNFDEPSALDHHAVLCHLHELLAGRPVEKPCYDFHTHTRTGSFRRVEPAPLIILEGNYAYWDSRISSLMDLTVYVDAELDVRLIRRLRRDVAERGCTMDSSITQYLETLRPMHRMHIEPTKQHADLIIDTSESFAKSLAELICVVAEYFTSGKTFRGSRTGEAAAAAEMGSPRHMFASARQLDLPSGEADATQQASEKLPPRPPTLFPY